MFNVILIDDEKHCLDTLEILLNEYCDDVNILEKCRSGKSGLVAIEKHKPDLVLLDIEMPGMNGFEMLEQVNNLNFAIIFTTSFDQYAIKAIRFSALDYLLKPVDHNELCEAINKVKDKKELPALEQFQILLNQVIRHEQKLQKIAIPTLDGFELLPADQIISCEADDNYTYFYTKNNKKVVACRTLKEIEEQLQSFKFFLRVHHSYIVNLNEVTRYVRGDGGYLVMSDNSNINVSRSRKESLLKFF